VFDRGTNVTPIASKVKMSDAILRTLRSDDGSSLGSWRGPSAHGRDCRIVLLGKDRTIVRTCDVPHDAAVLWDLTPSDAPNRFANNTNWDSEGLGTRQSPCRKRRPKFQPVQFIHHSRIPKGFSLPGAAADLDPRGLPDPGQRTLPILQRD
jgi:hypothetical protein